MMNAGNIWGIPTPPASAPAPAPAAPHSLSRDVPRSVHANTDNTSTIVIGEGGKEFNFARGWKALTRSDDSTQSAIRVGAGVTLIVLLLVTSGIGIGSGKNKGWNWTMLVLALVLLVVLSATFVVGGFQKTLKPRHE